MAQGDFSPAKLLDIQLKAEAMWQGAQALQNPVNAESAKAVLDNQTAQFSEFDDYTTKNKKVVVTWLKTCDMEDEECVSNCTIEGDEIEAASKAYEPNICRQVSFSVDATEGRNDSYETDMKIATAMSKAITKLDEFWAKQVLASIDLFAGDNAFPAPYTYSSAQKSTYIPEAEYNLNMYAHLILQAQRNLLGNAYYIDNGDLMAYILNAQLSAGNADGKGDQARAQALNMYHDLFSFGKAGVSDTLFAISPDAVAMKTVNYNPATTQVLGGSVQQTIYRVNSRAFGSRVQYDVYYQLSCKTVNGKAHYIHSFRVETNGFVALNPEGCPITVGGTTIQGTGILGYTKGTAPVTPEPDPEEG